MSGGGETAPLGLVAGSGGLPVAAARAIADSGRRVVAVGFEGLTESGLESAVESFRWLRLGQLEALSEALREMGARRLLLAGKVPKTLLFDGSGRVEPDPAAIALLSGVRDRGDEVLLGALADWLVARRFELCAQDEVLRAMRAPRGRISRLPPDPRSLDDLSLGLPVLRALGRVGVGQCVVLKDGAVLAVEAIEGTDEAIRRAGRLGGPGATVIKAARPEQDRRFDLPVVGPDTIATLIEAGARALALEAGSVLLLDAERWVAEADEAGIAVWGFAGHEEDQDGEEEEAQ